MLGAGAFAGITIHTIEELGLGIEGVYDDAAKEVVGHPVTGSIGEFIRHHVCDLYGHVQSPAIIGIGSNRARKNIATRVALAFTPRWQEIISRHAVVFPGAVIGPGSIVVAGAVVEHGVYVGPHTIIDSCAEVAHDCQFEGYVHVSGNVTLGGGVRVGEGALLGLGCVILPRLTIGKWAVIGAGSVVLRDVEPYLVVAGNPARLIRRLQ